MYKCFCQTQKVYVFNTIFSLMVKVQREAGRSTKTRTTG